ncbi:hypothetical protein [Alicyclobacillus acidiphilus]|uniref:hypothetical protein n=1 Tax=Alicyclobacillus acidiphilus TaxID=182455 RepID=UPI000AB4E3AF|nr:hypothetical protein [Alicyclobacillus acidiphilus]
MNHPSDVDATPCFLPIFMLFGLGAGSRAAAANPYGAYRYGGPIGPGMGPGAYGLRLGPGRAVPRSVAPGSNGFVSPYALGPGYGAGYGGVWRGPGMY